MNEPPNPMRLVDDVLAQNAAARPDKTALICENQRWTYAQLDDMAGRLAQALETNGIRQGDRVLLYLLNGGELVVGLFAALKAQAVFSVIDYATVYDVLRHIAADCGAAALITCDYQAESAARVLREVPSLRLAILTGPPGAAAAANVLNFEAIQAAYAPAVRASRRNADDLACLVYTSGSTGNPKGVMVTHRSALFAVDSCAEYLGLSEQDVNTSPLPLSYSMGMNQLLLTFRVGGTLILEKSFAFPAATLKRMATARATGFAAVPSVLALLMRNHPGRYDLGALRYITSMGAALPAGLLREVRDAFPRVRLYSAYGLAEASYSLGLAPDQVDLRPSSVGKPYPGTQAWLVDDDGRRLGPGGQGELVVQGGHVRSGYWNDPEATARRFRPGPGPGERVCFSGDVFRTDAEGYFYFVGRSDEMIKSGGKKVAPREIETALHRLPGIVEAAAVGIPDPLLGQVIKACVVVDQARADLTAQDILRHCRQTLEEYKVPRQIEIRDSLPKTPSGKIRKTELMR